MSSVSQLLVNKKIVAKEFNNVASSYDFATSMSQGYREDLGFSASLLNLKGDEHVLDLCCGTGKSTSACLQYITTGKIIGVDNSEGMLEVANKKFQMETEDGMVEFSLQDAMNLNFPEESFDAIFVAYGLRNMPDYDQFIGNLFKLLKKGGKLCIHDYSIVDRRWARWFWAVLGYGFIVPFCTIVSGSSRIYRYLIKSVLQFPSPTAVVKMIREQNFSDVKIHRHHSWRKPILHAFTAIK